MIEFQLLLTEKEIQKVMKSLAKEPYFEVAETLQKIAEQMAAQKQMQNVKEQSNRKQIGAEPSGF